MDPSVDPLKHVVPQPHGVHRAALISVSVALIQSPAYAVRPWIQAYFTLWCDRLCRSTTIISRPFFRDHPGEPVPEENLWTYMVQGKINGGRHTDHPAGRHSIQSNQCLPPPSTQ